MAKGKSRSPVNVNERAISSRIAVAIKEGRKRKGYSLEELGERTQCSASYINRLERFQRKNPSLSILWTLCKELDLDFWKMLKIALNDEEDESPDVVDLIMNSNFTIDGIKIESPEIRKMLMDIMKMIVYQLDEGLDFTEVVPLAELIRKFHKAKRAVSKGA